jgi:class 3 adenylate cyclase/DNA-binding response OmpR family regulator
MRSRIMIVGRDVALRARLARLLNGGRYHVEIAENAQHACRVGLEGVALAIVAPEGLGSEKKDAFQELRAAVGNVLLVAAPGARREPRSDILDVSDEAGLLARVAEALPRAPEPDKVEPVLEFRGYRLDLAGHSLVDQTGREIPLTSGEFGLLRAFVQRPGRVLTRDQLMQVLTGRDAEAYDRSIDMQILRLRRKIEPDPKRPGLIVTIPGSGYKFAARVTAEAIGAPGETASEAAATMLQRPLAPAAERRQLTIMQCAMSGPAFQSVQCDPEDLHRLLTAFHESCGAIIAEAGGVVAKLLNDGVLAYFGYPQADEHQAERAIRAARGLVQAPGRADVGQTNGIRARVAIATGLVLVGDLFGDSGEQAALGEPASLAAGLVAHAASGTVLISATTRCLVGELFRCEEREPIALPGFSKAIAVWQVVGEGVAENRFEALHGRYVGALVGREEELALLLRRWDQAKAGEGQVVLLSGEAGIGKSRVLAALAERVGDEPQVRLRYQCSPHHVNDPFYPITSEIWHAAGFVSGEPAAARLDKLEAMIARSGLEAMDIAPFLASLLSIPFEGRYPLLEMAPGEQKERTIAALIALFEGLTKDAPLLVALEDAHWIDPTSLDVFGRLVDRRPNLRALLFVTFRPEFASPWVGRANVASLPLSRFGKRHTLALVDRVTRDKALPSEVLEQIVAKTDGVPLFVEELTEAVLGSGLLREENGAYVLVSALIPLAIPSTLQDSLMARLDRLAPVKEIAQIAAAIGREFSYRLLEAAAPIRGPALEGALGQLMAAELIHSRGSPPEATYVFKHALVQDAAYASLIRSRRRRIHADIARALVERFADQIDAAPDVIARHYTEAGLAEPAARYWLKAAELALSRSAPVEAENYIDSGLALLSRLTDGSGRQFLELSLRLARCNALLQVKGWAAPETVAALTVAKQLLDAGAGTDLQRFSVLFGLCFASSVAARMEPALALAREFVAVAERQDDTIYRLVGHRLVGMIQVMMGRNREALVSLQQCERYSDPVRQKKLSYRFGTDPGLAARCYKTLTLQFLGLNDQAARETEQVLAELPSHGHAFTVALCNGVLLPALELHFGDLEACERHSVELVTYCVEKKVEIWRSVGVLYYACVRATREPTKENIAALRTLLAAKHSSGAYQLDSLLMAHLAQALLTAGEVTGAEAALKEAFVFVEQSGERYWLAELHRLEGQIALERPEPDHGRAGACFLQAIEVARRQEARMLELRAATDLARLWRDTGSNNDPRMLLEPILAAIEGGENKRDVRNARALLAERVSPAFMV